MNKEIEFFNDKVIVKNQYGTKKERKLSQNIEEILITENNIEEIENLIDKSENQIKRSERSIKNSYLDLFLAGLWAFNFILNSITGNWLAAICNIFCSACWGCTGYFLKFKPEKKFIKASKLEILTLHEQLEKEKGKLIKLNNNNQQDTIYFDTSKRKIETSELIKELKDKLNIINIYQVYKNKFIKSYKKGTLKNYLILFGKENHFEFIVELIKNDIADKEFFKDKQKVLKK